MITCNLKVCAVISKAATLKTAKEGNTFLSFNVKLPIEGRDHTTKDFEMSVSLSGDKSKLSVYTAGRRVNMEGTLTFRKKGGVLYNNFRAESAELANSKASDVIEGTMTFRGKIGNKGIEEKRDKNEKVYKVFSAFSTDRYEDHAEFTWVRFLYFNPKEGEDFLVASSFIEAKGDLQLGVYKSDITIDCRVSEVSPWVLDNK